MLPPVPMQTHPPFRRSLFLLALRLATTAWFAVALLPALMAHDVVWYENPDGTHPTNQMGLYFDAGTGSDLIRIQPQNGENCTVEVVILSLSSTLATST